MQRMRRNDGVNKRRDRIVVESIDASNIIKSYTSEPVEIFKEEKEPSPFDFVKSVSNTKHDITEDNPEIIEYYNPYIVNRALSYFPDTVLLANDLNLYHNVPLISQYYYYMGSIRKRNRFAKWEKPKKDTDIILIQKIYNVRMEVAKQYRKLISDKDMKKLYELTETDSNPKSRNSLD
jgi:hypothetical protein